MQKLYIALHTGERLETLASFVDLDYHYYVDRCLLKTVQSLYVRGNNNYEVLMIAFERYRGHIREL